MRAVRLSITGRVQGVGYRWWTVRMARALGVAGWVRNEADGSVSAHAEGDGAAIAALIAECGSGPPGARVDGVHASVADHENFGSFEQR